MSDESEITVENLDTGSDNNDSGSSGNDRGEDSNQSASGVESDETGNDSQNAENEAIQAARAAGEAERDSVEQDAAAGDGEGAGQDESFKPNFKIKVADKEFDIPENFRSLMKDKDTEKEIRDIFEKAHGVDFIKSKQLEAAKTRDAALTEMKGMKDYVQGLGQIYRSAVDPVTGNINRLDRFFKELQIPENILFNYVANKIRLQQLPPEQQAEIQKNIMAEERADQYAKEKENVSLQYQSQSVQIKEILLNQGLSQPEVSKMAQAYEQMVGKPGSFKQAVIEHAKFRWFESKQDLTPEQAIQEVIAKYNLKPNDAATAPVVNQNQRTINGKPVVQRTERTIPNVQGRGTSPVKKMPKNLDDIRKLYQQASQQ